MEAGDTTDAGTLRRHLDEVLPDVLRGDVAGATRRDRGAALDVLARYLAHVLAANRSVNLTRITSPREAVVKHLVDSLLPYRVFEEWTAAARTGEEKARQPARTILDLGTGPGFPGVPLAVWFPDVRVHLVESIQKKARAVADAVRAVGLDNVEVHPVRAEDFLRECPVHTVVARAVGSARKVLRLLRPVRSQFTRLVLYKGPEAAAELEEAQRDATALGLGGAIVESYDLPDGMGHRTVVVYA